MEQLIKDLYIALLTAWNNQDAVSFAELFYKDGNVIGYDGSPLNGKEAIFDELSQIFAHHSTAKFVYSIREIRELTDKTVLLRAIVGMVPRDTLELMESVNALQSMIAVKKDNEWKIALFQNTPAAFHGRPKEAEKMTEELQTLIPSQISL